MLKSRGIKLLFFHNDILYVVTSVDRDNKLGDTAVSHQDISIISSPVSSCTDPMLSAWPEFIDISVSSGEAPSFADLQIDGTSAWRIPDAAPNVEWIEVKCSAHYFVILLNA